MALAFFPEMWFDAAEFCFLNNMEDDGTQFLVVRFPDLGSTLGGVLFRIRGNLQSVRAFERQ
jgi:hypothetical protein